MPLPSATEAGTATHADHPLAVATLPDQAPPGDVAVTTRSAPGVAWSQIRNRFTRKPVAVAEYPVS